MANQKWPYLTGGGGGDYGGLSKHAIAYVHIIIYLYGSYVPDCKDICDKIVY